jgi:hypothetical protein
VLAVAVGLGLVSLPLDGDLATVTHSLALAAATWFAATNRHVTGLFVAGIGLVLNLAGLVLNNGLAVRGEALVRIDAVEAADLRTHDFAEPRHLETDADGFPWLGATVPVPLAREVVTFADLIVLVGILDATRDIARRRARLPLVAEDDDEDTGYGVPEVTAASADQDWGAAPSPSPESGSQYSENREERTAEANEFWRDAAVAPSPAHLAARQDK